MYPSTQRPPTMTSFPMAPVSEGRPTAPRSPRKAMQAFEFSTEPVRAADHSAQWTGVYVAVGYVAAIGAIVAATLASMGGFLVLLGIGAVAAWFQAKKVRAQLRGSGVALSSYQLPELYELVTQFASRLGLKETPELYIVEESVQNGVAVKLGKKNIVLLTDDVVWGALESRDPRSVAFVIAHELAHVALGHTGALRTAVRGAMPPLSRLDELSADNVAKALIGDTDVAVLGLTLLTVGPQLLPYINEEALHAQAREVMADKLTKKAEKTLTHPLLMRRIGNLLG